MDFNVIENEMNKLPNNTIVVFVIKNDYAEKNFEILNYLLNKRTDCGIYVTANTPYNVIEKNLRDRNMPTDNIFFIDMISQISGDRAIRKENCLFLPSPQNLTDLGIALSEITESIKDRKYFIFLDSLSTLLIYNQFDVVAKFSHFLTAKMRRLNVDGIFLSLNQKDDSDMISIMCQVCDKVIYLDDMKNSTQK